MENGGLTIAIAIPHTPWVPERVRSVGRVREALAEDGVVWREFTDREPNTVWSVKLWSWLRDSRAGWGVQLQDDCVLAPKFWPILRAMLAALPPSAGVVGLANVHPMAIEIARRGERWFVSPGHVVGWAYAMRHDAIAKFLEDRANYDDAFRAMNEDEQIGEWCRRTAIPVWHPCPTIVEHDTTIPSTYQNDRHTLKRPTSTWRDFETASMCDPSWWTPSKHVEMLQVPPQRACWFCNKRNAIISSETGCCLCAICLMQCVGRLMGVQVTNNDRGT